jgi:hypothetical protein
MFDTTDELNELQARIETSSRYQDRASKRMLLALIRIVYRLALRVEELERRE